MIFFDTSGIFALADEDDPNHSVALTLFNEIMEMGEELLIHNYIVDEAVALLQRRLGFQAAAAFLNSVSAFRVHWITPEEHADAVDLFLARGFRNLSLVDCASFIVMRNFGLSQAFAFDGDFDREGFERRRPTRLSGA